MLVCTWWLNEHGEHPNQVEVARQAGTDIKMASEVLRGLEARKLIKREPDPADGRANRVRVTARGAAMAPRAITAVEQDDADFFSPGPAGHAARLLARLDDANPS